MSCQHFFCVPQATTVSKFGRRSDDERLHWSCKDLAWCHVGRSRRGLEQWGRQGSRGQEDLAEEEQGKSMHSPRQWKQQVGEKHERPGDSPFPRSWGKVQSPEDFIVTWLTWQQKPTPIMPRLLPNVKLYDYMGSCWQGNGIGEKMAHVHETPMDRAPAWREAGSACCRYREYSGTCLREVCGSGPGYLGFGCVPMGGKVSTASATLVACQSQLAWRKLYGA